MAKSLGSQHGGSNCFKKLPDDLVIFIFTKLSSSSDEKHHDSRKDLKALGPCIRVSKRFNALACLVPTSLSIEFPLIIMLYKHGPKIIEKFKYIRSLQVTHSSKVLMGSPFKLTNSPAVTWGAAYRPNGYCLAVASFKKVISLHHDEEPQLPVVPDATPKNDEYHESIWSHAKNMIRLHHMLVSSIKDHRYLRRVVVTDFESRGTLTLEEDLLAQLRNCTSTNLEHVLVRDRFGSANELVITKVENLIWSVIKDVCFCIIEWQEKATDEDVMGIPADVPESFHLKCNNKGDYGLKNMIGLILKDPAKVEVNKQSKAVLNLLSYIEEDGNLL